MAHPLETIMHTTIAELRQLVDVDTIVGSPVTLGDGRLVLPVSKVTVGFVSGGAEYGTKNPVLGSGLLLDGGNRAYPFAGTLTAGVSVTPVAFLSAAGDRVDVLPAAESEPYARLARLLPQLLEAAGELVTSLTAGRSGE